MEDKELSFILESYINLIKIYKQKNIENNEEENKNKIKDYLQKVEKIYKQIQTKKETFKRYNEIEDYIDIQIDLIELIINDKITNKLCLSNIDIIIKNCENVIEKLKNDKENNSTNNNNNSNNIPKINNENIKNDNIGQIPKNSVIKKNSNKKEKKIYKEKN